MNNLKKAEESLYEFMESEEKIVLITGTHQYEKHLLALRTIKKLLKNSKVLFRINGLDNASEFLKAKKPLKTGTPYSFGGNILYIDSINSITWNKAPSIDYSVLYPIESVCRMKNRNEVIDNLLIKTDKKVLIVSWTDVHDLSWLNNYIDRHVIYDAEEDDPAYHERVLDIISKKY